MEHSKDITDILRSWEYDSDNQVRIIQADDGREVLQIRQPLGIEQYELDGRPDGKSPENRECFLEVLQARLESHLAEHGSDAGYRVSHRDFVELQNEAVLYYYRYLVLFQIGDFERTIRDTEHNLAICDLMENYAEAVDDKKEVLQYRPYILRMNAISKAMISLQQQLQTAAREILESAIAEIEGMPEIDTPAFQFERIRSLKYLRSTLQQVLEQKASPLDSLRQELDAAIQDEDYEKAAELRDRIRALKQDYEL
ncbi:MAG: UvrB/UvrC motif-containing protein [Spirochaetales bacterium]|nr:UvrB/UvrC motif-containing protein [Spirochaetales bacterium]